jgi:hypothetical protein
MKTMTSEARGCNIPMIGRLQVRCALGPDNSVGN